MIIFQCLIANISKTKSRTDSKPTSLESEDLINTKNQSPHKTFYRFVLQKNRQPAAVFWSFSEFFGKLNIFRFSFVHNSKTTRRSCSKPTSFESEGHFNAKNHSADKNFYRFVLQKTSLRQVPIFAVYLLAIDCIIIIKFMFYFYIVLVIILLITTIIQ